MAKLHSDVALFFQLGVSTSTTTFFDLEHKCLRTNAGLEDSIRDGLIQ